MPLTYYTELASQKDAELDPRDRDALSRRHLSPVAPWVTQQAPFREYEGDSRQLGELAALPGPETAGVDEQFLELAGQWRRETINVSSVHQLVLHPAYQRIVALGRPVLPSLLVQLRDQPDQWFYALTAITGEDPTQGAESFDEAVAAWLAWGRERQLL
jgi:hypothetical protein